VAVRGGSVRGGFQKALGAMGGGKAVAEGAVLEARPVPGDKVSSAAVASGSGSAIVLRRCELRTPGGWPLLQPMLTGHHATLMVLEGGRATAADCACGWFTYVCGQGSVLLHSGLAFPPGLGAAIVTQDGGEARELPAAAGGAGAPRAGVPAMPLAPPEAGSGAAGAAVPVVAAGAVEAAAPATTVAAAGVGEAAALAVAVEGSGSGPRRPWAAREC
jgi:hypothetical protein